MIPARETILQALLDQVTGPPCIVAFTADTTANSAVLANPSSLDNLVVGMPVWGENVADDSVITSLSPLALSGPATVGGSGVALTQGFRFDGKNSQGTRAVLEHWSEKADQPAIFVADADEAWNAPATGIPQKPEVEAEIWVYAKTLDPDLAPGTLLNALLDAIDTALAPTPVFTGYQVENAQTLGGLVTHCRIEGRVRKYGGHLEGQAVAMIPVKMLVPQ